MIEHKESLKLKIIYMIRENPGMVRTEVRDKLQLQNNIVGPCIKSLIDARILTEGMPRVSSTTHKPGKSLYLTEDWKQELDAQNRIFE